MLNFLAIFFITWKALTEEVFFIQESQPDHDQPGKRKRQCPPRTQSDGREKIHHQSADIHRMPHSRVRSRGNQPLLRNNDNDRRRETVFLESAELDQESEEDGDICGYYQKRSHVR